MSNGEQALRFLHGAHSRPETGGKVVTQAKEHKIGLMKIGAVTLGILAIPASGGTSVALALSGAGLGIGAEAMDDKPCKSERVRNAVAIQGVSLGIGFLWTGAAQAAAEAGDEAARTGATRVGDAQAGADIATSLAPNTKCDPQPGC